MALIRAKTSGGGSATIECIPVSKGEIVSLQKNDIIVTVGNPNMPTAGTYATVVSSDEKVFYITANSSSWTNSSSYNSFILRLGDNVTLDY